MSGKAFPQHHDKEDRVSAIKAQWDVLKNLPHHDMPPKKPVEQAAPKVDEIEEGGGCVIV
jgi:hypothetical protein